MYYLTEEGKKFLSEDADKFRERMIRNLAFYRLKTGRVPTNFSRREKSQIDQRSNMQKALVAQKKKREAESGQS